MITELDYDWDSTAKDVLILIPNRGRRKYIAKTVANIKTAVHRSKWHVLAVNDGLHQDMSHLADHNLSYFTLTPDRGNRNGCFVRNYVIKRSKSEYVYQFDPEVITLGDFIANLLNRRPDVYRAGNKLLVGGNLTNKILRGETGVTVKHATAWKARANKNGPNTQYGVHYGFAVKTKLLQQINGYDEDYTVYAPEDTDLFYRLRKLTKNWFIDPEVYTAHLWHPKPQHSDRATQRRMKALFKAKLSMDIVRNKDRVWGEG